MLRAVCIDGDLQQLLPVVNDNDKANFFEQYQTAQSLNRHTHTLVSARTRRAQQQQPRECKNTERIKKKNCSVNHHRHDDKICTSTDRICQRS